MEERIKRIEILLILLILIVIINAIFEFLHYNIKSNSQGEQVTTTKDLPDYITKDKLDKIVYKIKEDFNNNKFDSLYNILNDYAKSQIKLDEVIATFSKLKRTIGNIDTYSYSHYTYSGFEDGADWYLIHYVSNYSNGKGTIKLTIRIVKNEWGITGLKINLDSI